MNVIQREKLKNIKTAPKVRKELVRRASSLGIRGMIVPAFPHTYTAKPNKVPRYQFDNEPATSKKNMGPPLKPLRNTKRKLGYSTSSKLESTSSGPGSQDPKRRPRILASDSAVADTSYNLCTPRNRPTAMRYISSSSRGGNKSTRSTSTSAVDPSVILAISEGRGMARGEIGMAALDLKHPHLVLCQFSDTLLYTHTMAKINLFNPVEILIPNTFCEGVQPMQLYVMIKDQYPLVTVTPVQRKHFDDAKGRQNIQILCAPQYSAVYLQVEQKFYALTAAAAVLIYVENIQCLVFARESLKIEYHSTGNTMLIDVRTATQLELVQPLVLSAGPTCCLLGVLGPTYTTGGIRALRAAILQPSCNKQFIEARLDAIQDIIDNDCGLMVDLQDVMKKMTEIDKILFLCVENTNPNYDKLGEAQLTQILLLKTTIEMVPKLVEVLNSAASGRLRAIKMDLENPNYNEIAERIKNIIQEDCHVERGPMGSFQRCFAVKSNINGLLDVARQTYSELIEDMQKIVDQLAENYELPIKLNRSTIKGFHIVLPVAPKNRKNFNIDDLPEIFIQVHNQGGSVAMTTEDLVVMDHQAKETLNEIQKMSTIVIAALLKDMRPFMHSLYKLCEDVAELDILLALAQASIVGSYIRPEFSDYLEIRNCVHPLLDYYCQVKPIPNEILASPEYNFTIITGPNMGGKSIYIKQIAIAQIMAQLGCFLPATKAILRLCDRIFTRIGFNDSVELNASSYVLEIKEVQHILKGLTPNSLVIIDELCRGTSSEEGTSMAWAICEELILSDAFTFFTTHFIYLTRLQDLYFNVVNLQASAEETEVPENKLIYLHKIEPGVTKVENYGLKLAAQTSLPKETTMLANELAQLITMNTNRLEITTHQQNQERLLYRLNASIKHELRKKPNSNAVKSLIENFKKENLQLIDKLALDRVRNNNKDSSALLLSNNNNKRQENSISQNKITNNQTHSSEILLHNSGKKPEYDIPAVVDENINSVRTTNELVNCVIDENVHSYQSNDSDIEMNYDELISKHVETALMPDNFIVNSDYFNEESPSGNHKSNINEAINKACERHLENNNEYSDFILRSNIFDRNDDSSHGHLQNSDDDIEMPLYVYSADKQNENNIHICSGQSNDFFNEMDNNERNKSQEQNESKDSDIAEAQTQVLATYSDENSSEEIEDKSTDMELITETVNEIGEELLDGMCINIILTPPAEFRDV